LPRLEAAATHILREAVTEARNPVLLFSAGKDSTLLAHLALRAFFPAKPPFPLLHIDSTWEFASSSPTPTKPGARRGSIRSITAMNIRPRCAPSR